MTPASSRVFLRQPVDVGSIDANGLVVGKWHATLYQCMDNAIVPNCLVATCCPCLSLAQTMHRMGFHSFIGTLLVHGTCVGGGLVSISLIEFDTAFIATAVAFALLAAAFVARGRRLVRRSLCIPGNAIDDCIVSVCCSCCGLAQMATQARTYNATVCDVSPKDRLPGYHAT
ncbi:hypothetical protein ACHHYP_13000 [Achlya hypogyna]|uniref:PLAC8 family protein n=1 Tax=Achlya hypogyna TaxID=1202772 RepID=A0A1V9YGD2_ACHHY|nr:hypothetical protein ACHHYP_13000 [Achlya hypogyna]